MTRMEDFSWQCGLKIYFSFLTRLDIFFYFIGQNFEEGVREKIFVFLNIFFISFTFSNE